MTKVRTPAGTVRGSRENGLAVFRGIPYARPPVGDLRFAAPRPPEPWDGVRDALAFGPPVPQEGGSTGGDDWLTVNVWTPDPAARLPVMVWLYGGGYKFGDAADPGYDAGRLAREGGVVVVTLNYRVGVEGFALIEGAPANRGLLDQVAALEWVRDCVAGFGGDPGRVTVFGQSAGAGSIAALMTMPCARGLFRRAIAQSVPGGFFTVPLARDIARALAAGLGLRPTVGDLSAVHPRRLPEAGARLRMRDHLDRWGATALTTTPYAPVVDGEVLPCAPWEALAGGVAADVGLVVGHNRDEFRLFLLMGGLIGKVDEAMAAEALTYFGPGPDYRAAYPDASPERLYELVQSDRFFRMPSLHLAEAHTAGGGRAHLYELTWSSGACHALDVPLTFGVYEGFLARLLIGPEPTPEAEAVSAHLRRAWTSFAATGDPGWPAYTSGDRLTRILAAEPAVTAYPEETSRRLWRDHTFTGLSRDAPGVPGGRC
ncbi:carboxylesterase/lipase family protein [Streptomyces acidiscabies]|uniref:carboxylesterase/lipase family protein n=1 Tax=Streptomyces acidiscabies TaxID=42234 RepID=UPI00095143CA|nr:carboxylesterase family protein [Streptomyces acidiscabies]